MHLQAFAMFGILLISSPNCLAASLVKRQANPMSTKSPTPTMEPAPPSVPLPSPGRPKDAIYSIPLTAPNHNAWDYPVIQVKIGALGHPINLAVSLHSNETWLLSSSEGVCDKNKKCPVLEGDQRVTEDGKEKKWDYKGQSGLDVSGSQYQFSSFEPAITTGTGWRLDNFIIGVAWMEKVIEGLGKVDGVLGLGPGSTFLQRLTGSHEQAISMYLGKDTGILTIGGYLPNQASGDYIKLSTSDPGVLGLKVRTLSIKGDELVKDVEAIIDPGSPDIVIPKSVQETLVKNKNTRWTIRDDGGLEFSSEGPAEGNMASFELDLGDGVIVKIEEDAYTLANRPAFRVGPDNHLILGRPFLHSSYLVMDNTYTTYHIAQANSQNTDFGNPTPITVFENNNQGDSEPPKEENKDENKDDNKDEDVENDGEPDTDVESTGEDTTASDSSAPKKQMNIGAIIGGIVGGLVLLAVLFGVFLWRRRRRSLSQVHEIKGYMGTPKRMSEGSDFDIVAVSGARSISPQQILREDTHLMEGYPVQQHHPSGSRGSIFREEMSFPGPTPLPPSRQYHYEEEDNIAGFQGPSSRRPLRREQDLVRTESVVSTTDVVVPTTDRSAPNVPRLPIYNSKVDGAAL